MERETDCEAGRDNVDAGEERLEALIHEAGNEARRRKKLAMDAHRARLLQAVAEKSAQRFRGPT